MTRFHAVERPYAHLQSLRDRKILALRLLADWWLEHDVDYDPALDRFHDDMLASCSNGWADDPALPLSRYLKAAYLLAVKKRKAERAFVLSRTGSGTTETVALGPAPSAALRALRLNITSDMRRVSCTRCARRVEGNCCADKPQDERLLHKGECLRPFHEMFDFVREETERVYRRDIKWKKKLPDFQIGFKTRRGRDGKVRGQTAFPPEDHAPSATDRHVDVEVILPVETFDAFAHHQLLYVLFHELVVHAPEQALAPAKRAAFQENCGLTEGVIDAVAYQVAVDSLKPRQRSPAFLVGRRQAFRKAIRRRHAERVERPKRLRSDASTQELRQYRVQHARATGHEAMHQLVAYGERLKLATPTLVRRFLLGINVLPLCPTVRRELLIALDQMPDCARQADFFGLMHAFVEDGDFAPIRRFLDDLKKDDPPRLKTALP